MESTIIFVAVLGFLTTFCQGQQYIIEDPENRGYISEQQEFTDSSIPFRQNAELQGAHIQSADFYLPRDLQTSELPLHLQQTLLQYRPHTFETVPKHNFQNKILNVPVSSKPFKEYVKPSTHRPNYSHLFSQGNLHNSLQTETINQQVIADNPLDSPQFTIGNLYETNNNRFEKEDTEKGTIKSKKDLTLHTSSDKKSILKSQRRSSLLDLQEAVKENPRHDMQEIQNIETADNDSIEDDYESYTQSTSMQNSEDNSNDKENQNYIDDEEYDEDYLDDQEDSEENSDYVVNKPEEQEETNETYEVLTMKPMITTHNNTFNDFVDIDSMDTTTQESASSDINTQLPIFLLKSSSADMKKNDLGGKISKPSTMEKIITTEKKKDFPEVVVSVVTSKTIVNNTIISPFTISKFPTSSPIKSVTHKEETSTDSWIVVASVQTSKSISGARYLPSSVVEQHSTNKKLNEPDDDTKESVIKNTENDNWSVETTTADVLSTNTEASTKIKTSTESLIDKLDRVQSDLSSGLLAGGFKNDNIAVIDENIPVKMDTITEVITTSSTTKLPYPQVNIRKFNAGNRSFRQKSKDVISSIRNKPIFTTTTSKSFSEADIPRGEEVKDSVSIFNKVKPVSELSDLLPPGYKIPKTEEINIGTILKNRTIVDDISALLPPGYNLPKPTATEKPLTNILAKLKPVEDISALLPPGYKPPKPDSTEKSISNILGKAKPLEGISALLPPGYKSKIEDSNKSKDTTRILQNAKSEEGTRALLPPGFKVSTSKDNNVLNHLSGAKPITDISSLLPPDYKPQKQVPTEKLVPNILAKAKPVDDISSLLPPGYRTKPERTSGTRGYKGATPSIAPEVSQSIEANQLPPGHELDNKNNETSNTSARDTDVDTTAKPKLVKLVFPSRPGGGSRKTSRLTTSKIPVNEEMNKPTSPTIQKGWPIRASTEFTGWPTPSTTPISIEKLLEAARSAWTSTTTTTPTTVASTTSTAKPTTTTPKPTTPGICVGECDLAGTIKLVGGAKWVPELLDRNTKEWQILANDVQSELESLYSSSPVLKPWYRKIRIDGFSEGSVLVDYLVELNEIGQKVNTQEIKHLFHESLAEVTGNNSNRGGKSLNETKSVSRALLGHFELDTKFTDFIVIPKHSYPTVGYAEDSILLPQWAIAVIVIGLASLLFVIIFGVTVLVNRHKSSKKTPAPLTEDMLNELNKNHMGGFDNYAAEDFYNMEDVWSDKPYEQKPHKKKTNDSIYDNSMSNLYDSWRSQWNGSYDNRYEGNPNSSQHTGYLGPRRPKYDTDF